MFFRKKRKPIPPVKTDPPKMDLPSDLHGQMYQTFLAALQTALAQPHPDMTPEQLAEKIIPKSVFSDAERAQMLKEASDNH